MKQAKASNRDIVIKRAVAQCNATGKIDAAAIARDMGTTYDAIIVVLRNHDIAVGLPRTCQWALADGRRCSEPLGADARGNLRIKCCPSHIRRLHSVQAEPKPAESATRADIVRVDTVNGWPLAVVRGSNGEQALVEDEELGRRLGYERPADVRALVARIFSGSEVIRTVRKSQSGMGRPASVALLTREQAVLVAMRSETAKARELQEAIIAVFLAWQDGKLPARAPATPSSDGALAGLAGAVAELVRECRASNETTRMALEALIARPGALAGHPPAPVAKVAPPPSDPARGMWGWEDIAREAGLPVSKALAGRSRGLAKLALELAGVWQNPTFGKSGVTALDDSWAYAPAMLGDVLRPLRTIGAKLTYEMGADHGHTARVNEAYEHARKRLREAFGKGAAA